MAQVIRKFENGGSTAPELYTSGYDKWDKKKLIQAVRSNAQTYLDNNHISGKMADMFNDSLSRAISGIKNGTFIYNDDGSFTDTTGQTGSTGHRDSNLFGTKNTENNANGFVAHYLNSLMTDMPKYVEPKKEDFDLKQQISTGLQNSFHGNKDAYDAWMTKASPLEKATKIKEVMKGLVPQVGDWFNKYNMEGSNWKDSTELTNSLNNLINTHSIDKGKMAPKFNDLALKAGLDLSDLYAIPNPVTDKKPLTEKTGLTNNTVPPVVKKAVPAYTTDKQFLSTYAPYLKMGRNSTNMTTWLDAGNLKSPVGSYGFANQHKVNNNWRDQGFLSSDYIQKMLNTVDKDNMGKPKAGYFSPAGRMMRNNVMTAFNDAASRGDMIALKDGSMAILPSYDNGRIWVFHNQNDPNPSKRGYMEQVNAFSYPELLPKLYNAYRQGIQSKKSGGILKGSDGMNLENPGDPIKNTFSKTVRPQYSPQANLINAKRNPQQSVNTADGSRKVKPIYEDPLDPENIRTLGAATALGTGVASLFPGVGAIVGGAGSLFNLATDLGADIAEHKSPWKNLGINLAMTAGSVLTNGAGNWLRGISAARKAMAAGKVAEAAPSIFKARSAVSAAETALKSAKTEEEVAAATKALESAKSGVSDAMKGITDKLSSMRSKAITSGLNRAGWVMQNGVKWGVPVGFTLKDAGKGAPATLKLITTPFTGDDMTEQEHQDASRFMTDLAGVTYASTRALKSPTMEEKVGMAEGQRTGTLPQNHAEAVKYRDIVKGNSKYTPVQIANAEAQVRANPSNIIRWAVDPEAKSFSSGYNGRFGMKGKITPNLYGDISAPVDMNILNSIRNKTSKAPIAKPLPEKPIATTENIVETSQSERPPIAVPPTSTKVTEPLLNNTQPVQEVTNKLPPLSSLINNKKSIKLSGKKSPLTVLPATVKKTPLVTNRLPPERISRDLERVPFLSKALPNEAYLKLIHFVNPYFDNLMDKFKLSPDVIKTIFTEGAKNSKIHASDEYINNVKKVNPELADYLTKMNQDAATKGYKKGGVLHLQVGGSIVSGIGNAKDWYNNIHLKYRDALAGDISSNPQFYQTVNNLQSRFATMHNKYPNLKNAYRDPEADALQSDIKTFTPYVNTLGLNNASKVGMYKTTGIRNSKDSAKNNWKTDGLWGGETDDRRVLGRVGDYNPQQLQNETNFWKGKGYNMTADPTTNYYMLNPINTGKNVVDKKIAPKKPLGKLNVNPADVLSLGRAIAGQAVNNSATDKYIQSLNPVIKSTYQLESPIYGNYIGKTAANNQASGIQSLSRIPVTSNASLQIASQLDAASKGADARLKGQGMDADMFYKTLSTNNAVGQDNQKRFSDIGNENLTAMRSMDAGKAAAIYRKDLANYNQIWSPYLAQTEAQFRENNALNKNLQFQQYQNQFSDLWNSKMASLGNQFKNGQISEDEYYNQAKAERTKQTQALLNIQKQIFSNPYMFSFGEPEVQKGWKFKKGGAIKDFNTKQVSYAKSASRTINKHTEHTVAASKKASKSVTALIRKGMGLKK